MAQLTHNSWNDMDPDWARTGGRIAFVSDRTSSNGEIFTMAADGSDLRRLTTSFDGDRQPSWSPLAERLAFYGSRPEGQALYTVRADGTDIRLLVPQSLRPGSPAWDYTGESIVFSGYRPGKRLQRDHAHQRRRQRAGAADEQRGGFRLVAGMVGGMVDSGQRLVVPFAIRLLSEQVTER